MTDIGDGKLACPYDARGLHDSDLEGLGPPVLKPPVESRDPTYAREASIVPLYQKAEAEVFNLLVGWGGTGVPPHRWVLMGADGTGGNGGLGAGDGYILTTDVAVDLDVCAWTAIYLYELLSEDRRPNQWTAPAIAQFRTMADTLLANQLGSPTVRAAITSAAGTFTAANLNYGGLAYLTLINSAGLHDEGPWERDQNDNPSGSDGNETVACFADTTAIAGMALIRAYQYFGAKKYRDAYLRVATWMHRSMHSDKLVNHYSVDVNGGRLHIGTWPVSTFQSVTSGGYCSNLYPCEALIGLEFLSMLSAQEGDITIGDSTACTDFATQPAPAAISAVVSEVKSFWVNGFAAQTPRQTDLGIAPTGSISGFSGQPHDYLRVFLSGWFGSAHPRWECGRTDNQQPISTIWGMGFAYAMRGWYAAFGYDDTLASVWSFFMATTTGSDYTVPTDTPTVIRRQTCMGTYTPGTSALAQAICVEHTGGSATPYVRCNFLCDDCAMGLDWGTVGVLADLWVARNPSGFATAKGTMSTRIASWDGQKALAPAVLRYTGVDNQVYPLTVTTHPSSGTPAPAGYSAMGEPARYLAEQIVGQASDPLVIGIYHPRALDALGAAMAGLAYRRQPKIYAVKDHPPRVGS